ncbi:lipopolysaccharide biosynthesis protein [Shimia sp. CNT1-13L.2]|uniref:lipopolysaccharide biosynthesis protein n=1 Tax=Shimia sp. CNT1-13L.2 TaxID=2959663 RepID=UPI0020CD1C19|nr:lipopolysaccharide biosynthesis protein [Shimia sp. CNT1-13L.2]
MTTSAPPHISRPPSLRRNIGFAIAGRGYYALTQFLVVAIAARLGSPEDVGALTLAAAIVTPLFFLATMGTRDVLTVDDLDHFKREDYVALRLLGGCLAVVLSILAAFLLYRSDGAFLLLSVTAFAFVKFFGAQASMNHAMFQRAERLDYVALSLLVRGSAGIIAFTLIFWQTRNLPVALACEALAWALSFWIVDRNLLGRLQSDVSLESALNASLRRVGKLFLWVLPVGIALWMLRASSSVPALMLERDYGLQAVGLFGALFYVHTALSMLANTLGSASAARLRRYLREGRHKDFTRLSWSLVKYAALFGALSTALAWVFGAQLLTLLFGAEYADRNLFTIIVFASSITLAASPLVTAVTAAQAFRWRVVISGSSLLAACLAALLLIPVYGTFGAAWTFVLSSVAYLGSTLIACRRIAAISQKAA